MLLKKIISGAQTGADRAALDVAIINGLPHGGWVPKDRKAEDGEVPEKYQVIELSSNDYRQRTEMNVKDTDGTLIITHGKLTGGSALTQKYAQKHDKPCLHIDAQEVSEASAAVKIYQWIGENKGGDTFRTVVQQNLGPASCNSSCTCATASRRTKRRWCP